MEATRDFPISRQNLVGFQREDAQIAVLIADWTSAEEKDKFEPGTGSRNYKSCIFCLTCLLRQDSSISPSSPRLGRWLTRQTRRLLGTYGLFFSPLQVEIILIGGPPHQPPHDPAR